MTISQQTKIAQKQMASSAVEPTHNGKISMRSASSNATKYVGRHKQTLFAAFENNSINYNSCSILLFVWKKPRPVCICCYKILNIFSLVLFLF